MFNPTWFYAGAVYAGAIALARRAHIDIPKRVAVFFYALVFVFMYLPLTQDYVNLPVDFLRTLPPWAYTTADRVALNNQTNDIPLQIVPWAHQVRESWRALTPPLWNNASACGYPLLASAQSSALSPLRLLGLPLSLAHAMTFEAAMKILLALTFMFLWCRRRGYSELASCAGSVAFGFSTFILVWLHFPIVTTACFVPAVFYIIDLLAERRTYPRFVAGALVWAAMLFGGHPETASHTFFLAALYVAWIMFVERSVAGSQLPVTATVAADDELRGNRQLATGNSPTLHFIATLASSLIIAALIASPLLVPFFEAVKKSKRYEELARNPLTAEVPFSDWASAKLLVQPQFYGASPKPTWGPAHAESITGFAGTLGIVAWFALAAHVVARRKWRSREMFFVIATLIVLGVILSWPGVRELFHVVFRLAANARLRLFLCLLLSIQTAALIDLVKRDRRAVFIGLGCTAALLLIVFASTNFADLEQRTTALTSLYPQLAMLVIAAIAASIKRAHVALLFVLTGITAELFSQTHDWNPTVSMEWMYPRPPMLKALDEISAKVPKNEPFRIVGNGPMFFPNASAVYGYEDIRAHDPMANTRYIDFLRLTINYDAENYFAEWNEWEKRVVDYLNVRYVLVTRGGELPPRFRLVYDGEDGRIFENMDVLPRFFAVRNVILEFRDDVFNEGIQKEDLWKETAYIDRLELETEQQRGDFFSPRPKDAPMATTEIVSASPNEYRLHVKAPRYTLINSSVPWWPGWKVQRNGAAIEPIRVNGAFLGFAVPAGEVDVRVWYDPWTFRFGAIVSLATLAALAAYGFWTRQQPHAR
ncbi:MAG: YfhO family protein [Acidobacteriota bacterium]|nr:YfhO family protein [Acidobacteriota bacterium]